MRRGSLPAVLVCALALWSVAGQVPAIGANPNNRPGSEELAIRELLEGATGRREAWHEAPVLVVLLPVLEFTSTSLADGYVATGDRLTPTEIAELVNDMSRGLAELTGTRLTAFSAIRTESTPAGRRVKVMRPGQIVAGRFLGVQDLTGSLGYGARTSRDGVITAAAVILDRDVDRDAARRPILRLHELGHALGYNHVESRPSVMNPRMSSGVTDFDRAAIRFAAAQFFNQ